MRPRRSLPRALGPFHSSSRTVRRLVIRSRACTISSRSRTANSRSIVCGASPRRSVAMYSPRIRRASSIALSTTSSSGVFMLRASKSADSNREGELRSCAAQFVIGKWPRQIGRYYSQKMRGKVLRGNSTESVTPRGWPQPGGKLGPFLLKPCLTRRRLWPASLLTASRQARSYANCALVHRQR